MAARAAPGMRAAAATLPQPPTMLLRLLADRASRPLAAAAAARAAAAQKRFLNIHEYQARAERGAAAGRAAIDVAVGRRRQRPAAALNGRARARAPIPSPPHSSQGAQVMAERGVNVPPGVPVFSVDEVAAAAAKMTDNNPDADVVVKSQVLAGGRGLGKFTNGLQGGVHIVKAKDAPALAAKMLGGTLVTKQTGAAGKPVNALLVARKLDLVREMYLAILLDRKAAGPVVVACSEGGGREERGSASPVAPASALLQGRQVGVCRGGGRGRAPGEGREGGALSPSLAPTCPLPLSSTLVRRHVHRGPGPLAPRQNPQDAGRPARRLDGHASGGNRVGPRRHR